MTCHTGCHNVNPGRSNSTYLYDSWIEIIYYKRDEIKITHTIENEIISIEGNRDSFAQWGERGGGEGGQIPVNSYVRYGLLSQVV